MERWDDAVRLIGRSDWMLAAAAAVAMIASFAGDAGVAPRLLLALLSLLLVSSIHARRRTVMEIARLGEWAGRLVEGAPGDDAVPARPALASPALDLAARSLEALAGRGERLRLELGRLVRESGPEVERLAATTQELSAAGQEVAASVQELSDDAGAKAAAVQRAAEAGEMITAATREVVVGVTEAARLNASMRELAESQEAAIIESTHSVQAFIEDVRATAQGLGDLSAAAERTAAFVDTIRSITRQTNILALNAAIEAARFGESGHGFTVVADEVRTLAENAASAAQEIQSVVRDATRAADRLGRMLDRCLRTGELVALGVDEAVGGFRTVVEQTRSAADHMVVVQAGTEEIERQIKINAAALEELSAEITEVAAATEEMSATAEEMAAGLAEMADASARLNHLLRPDGSAGESLQPTNWMGTDVGRTERSGEAHDLPAHERVHA